jgi:hypothetical protein
MTTQIPGLPYRLETERLAPRCRRAAIGREIAFNG